MIQPNGGAHMTFFSSLCSTFLENVYIETSEEMNISYTHKTNLISAAKQIQRKCRVTHKRAKIEKNQRKKK